MTTVVNAPAAQPAYAPAPTAVAPASTVFSGYDNNVGVVDFCIVFLSMCCTLGIIAGVVLLVIGGIAGSGALVGVGIALIVLGVILMIALCICRPVWRAGVGSPGVTIV